jgi:hypothetical protein
MPISFHNLSLIYSVYLPLLLACAIGLGVFFLFRKKIKRRHLAIIITLTLPAVATLFTFFLGYKTPFYFGISAIVSSWHSLWVFVTLPASIILGIILVVLTHDSSNPKGGR